MGVQGIRKQVEKVTFKDLTFTVRFRGKKVGVDAMGWVHKLASRHSRLLKMGQYGRIVEDFVHQAVWAQRRGIQWLFVFDGAKMPGKHDTDEARALLRARSSREIEILESRGLTYDQMPKQLFAYAVQIKFPLITEIINALRQCKIEYIIAHFEADIQMKMLSERGCVHAIMSDDGDMILHNLVSLIWGWNWSTDTCVVLERATLESFKCTDDSKKSSDYSKKRLRKGKQEGQQEDGLGLLRCFARHKWDAFQAYGFLVGCDYYKGGVPGIGPQKAVQILEKCVDGVSPTHVHAALMQCHSSIKDKVPADFIERAQRALICFRHAYAYDPITREVVHATPIPEGEDYSSLLGSPRGGLAILYASGGCDLQGHFIMSPPSSEHPDGIRVALEGPFADGEGRLTFTVDNCCVKLEHKKKSPSTASEPHTVIGATLPPLSTWSESSPTTQELIAFLNVRDVTISATDTWNKALSASKKRALLVKLCEGVMKMESADAEGGSIPLIRDAASGSTVPSYFFLRNPVQLSRLMESCKYNPPPDNSSGWVVHDVFAKAPVMPVVVWMRWFEVKWGGDGREFDTKVFKPGRKRQCDLEAVAGLRFHASTDDLPGVVYFAWSTPASMKQEVHNCWIACSFLDDIVTEIVAAECTCAAGLADCHHVCALAMAVDEAAAEGRKACTNAEGGYAAWFGPPKSRNNIMGYEESLGPISGFSWTNERVMKQSRGTRTTPVKLVVGDPVHFDYDDDKADWMTMMQMPGMFDPTFNQVFDVDINKDQPSIFGAGSGTGTGRSEGSSRASKSVPQRAKKGVKLPRRQTLPLAKNSTVEISSLEFPENEDEVPAQQMFTDDQGR